MQGGHAFCEIERLADEHCAIGAVARQHARPVDRRERHRAQQFRVVLEAVARIGVGPRPVEHVLPVRVRFEEHRHRAGDFAVPLEDQDLRLPAGARRSAARVDQRVQELVAHERIAAAQAVPRRGVDAVERLDDAKADQSGGLAMKNCRGEQGHYSGWRRTRASAVFAVYSHS